MPIELREISATRVARGPVVLAGPFVSETGIVTGQRTDFVARLDKQTLKETWRKRGMAWIRSIHGENILVFAGKTRETQLWSGDGKVAWKRTGNEPAFGDRLYFHADGQLQVVDVLTGQVIEQFECPDGTNRFVHDGTLLLADPGVSTGPLQAIDLSGHRVRWQKDVRAMIEQRFGDPCPRGIAFIASRPGSVVVKTGAHLVGLSLADGSLQWGLPLSVPYIAPLARDGRMYVWSAPSEKAPENRLVIVDESSGAIVVDRPLAEYGPAFQRGQEVYGGTLCRSHVVFSSSSGLLAVFRLADGELAWRHEYGDGLSPVFADGRLYAATVEGDILVFEAHGGEL
jgi:outer membrane protein assembly factor BamB